MGNIASALKAKCDDNEIRIWEQELDRCAQNLKQKEREVLKQIVKEIERITFNSYRGTQA